jgi:hypothetical protein
MFFCHALTVIGEMPTLSKPFFTDQHICWHVALGRLGKAVARYYHTVIDVPVRLALLIYSEFLGIHEHSRLCRMGEVDRSSATILFQID